MLEYQTIFRENHKETSLTKWVTLGEAILAKVKAEIAISKGFGDMVYIMFRNPANKESGVLID